MADRVRITVAVNPEVLEVFKAMADTSGVSVSRCIGDWLDDTADAAQFVSQRVVEAREAPMTVMRELHARVKGTSGLLDDTMAAMRDVARERRRAQPGADSERSAPSSNTGLKGPKGQTPDVGRARRPPRSPR